MKVLFGLGTSYREYNLDNLDVDHSQEFRVLVSGSRGIRDSFLVKKIIDVEINKIQKLIGDKNLIIVEGGAEGVDHLARTYAIDNSLVWEEHPADWDDITVNPCNVKIDSNQHKYNSLAGMIRNNQMLNVSDLVIIIHDGKSSGTLQCYQEALKRKMNVAYHIIEK